MAKKTGPLVVITALLLAAALFSIQHGILDPFLDQGNSDGEAEPSPEAASIKVAAFNIQVFGRTKRSKPEVMDILVDVASEFDVMLVQEIRDSSGEKGSAYVYNDTGDVFEREPYVASFRSGGFDFTLVGIHTKPDDAQHEIGNLTAVVAGVLARASSEGDIVVMGDFNADGGYLDEDGASSFKAEGYYWIVENSIDMMTKTDWTYDRIVLLDGTYREEYVADSCRVFYFDAAYGIEQELTEDVSDYYSVYAVYRTDFPDDD